MRAKGWKGQSDSFLHYTAGPTFQEDCQNLGRKIRAILLDTARSWNYAHGIAQRMHGKRLDDCGVSELQKVVGVLMNGARGKDSSQGGKARPTKERAAPKSAPLCANGIKNAVLAYYRFQRKYPFVATECWECVR